MRAIAAIARKDLRLLFRDKGDVFFTFVFPVLMAMLFSLVERTTLDERGLRIAAAPAAEAVA